MNKIHKILKLDIGEVPENGGTFAPYKDKEDGIFIDTSKSISISVGGDLPGVPDGYTNWINIPEDYYSSKPIILL